MEEFLNQLNKCKNGRETIGLLTHGNEPFIMANFQKILELWYLDNSGFNMGYLVNILRQNCIFKKEEKKELMFDLIEFLNGSQITPIYLEYGELVNYSEDIKRLIYILCKGKLLSKLSVFYEQLRNIQSKIHFSNNFQKNMIELVLLLINLYKMCGKRFDLTEEIIAKLSNPIYSDDDLYREFIKPLKQSAENQLDRVIDTSIPELSNAEYIGSGNESIVFKIGNEVLKIFFKDSQLDSCSSNAILNFSNIIKVGFDIDFPLISIGITQYANCNWYEGLDDSEIEQRMYEVFERAYQDGYVIGDIKKENFGLIDSELKLIDYGSYVYPISKFDISKIEELIPSHSINIFNKFLEHYFEKHNNEFISKLQ